MAATHPAERRGLERFQRDDQAADLVTSGSDFRVNMPKAKLDESAAQLGGTVGKAEDCLTITELAAVPLLALHRPLQRFLRVAQRSGAAGDRDRIKPIDVSKQFAKPRTVITLVRIGRVVHGYDSFARYQRGKLVVPPPE